MNENKNQAMASRLIFYRYFCGFLQVAADRFLRGGPLRTVVDGDGQSQPAHRWYIGYDLSEVVPDHSSLSKIRERYGLEVFHRFFEHIIELCIHAKLVWGEELYFDSTKVQANADIEDGRQG